MALRKQMTYKSNFGDNVVFNDAYIKVESLAGSKDKIRSDVVVMKNADGLILDRMTYHFVPQLDGKNFIAQAYDFIKTMPEFSGAADC